MTTIVLRQLTEADLRQGAKVVSPFTTPAWRPLRVTRVNEYPSVRRAYVAKLRAEVPAEGLYWPPPNAEWVASDDGELGEWRVAGGPVELRRPQL